MENKCTHLNTEFWEPPDYLVKHWKLIRNIVNWKSRSEDSNGLLLKANNCQRDFLKPPILCFLKIEIFAKIDKRCGKTHWVDEKKR